MEYWHGGVEWINIHDFKKLNDAREYVLDRVVLKTFDRPLRIVSREEKVIE
jgi:hypothetical protein